MKPAASAPSQPAAPRSTSEPSPEPDPLLALLPTVSDADRPWLVWYSPTERIELTGHVLAMWAAKAAGLLAEQAPERPVVELAAAGSWRGVAWTLGTWLVGGCVRDHGLRQALGTGHATRAATAAPPSDDHAAALAPADVSVALDAADLAEDAELQVLLPSASLAVGWDGPEPLPPLVVDGVAEAMTYSDRFAPLSMSSQAPALVSPAHTVTTHAGSAGASRRSAAVLDRRTLALCVDTWAQEYRDAGVGARDGGLGGAVVRAGHRAPEPEPGGASDTAVIEEVLAVWAAGGCAVVVAADADDALVRLAAAQERALAPDAPRGEATEEHTC